MYIHTRSEWIYNSHILNIYLHNYLTTYLFSYLNYYVMWQYVCLCVCAYFLFSPSRRAYLFHCSIWLVLPHTVSLRIRIKRAQLSDRLFTALPIQYNVLSVVYLPRYSITPSLRIFCPYRSHHLNNYCFPPPTQYPNMSESVCLRSQQINGVHRIWIRSE